MPMEPRYCGRKRRLLAITATLFIGNSRSAVVPASLSLAFSREEAGWPLSAASAAAFSFSDASSIGSALTSSTPSSSPHNSADSALLSSSSHTDETAGSSRTPPPGIKAWSAWLSAAPVPTSEASSSSTGNLVDAGSSASQPHSNAGDSSASSDINGNIEKWDGSAGVDHDNVEIDIIATRTPAPSEDLGGDANGGIESVTSAPDAVESSPPPADRVPLIRFPQYPESPTPVSPIHSGQEAETPPPPPTPPPTDEATESPPPPRDVLGLQSRKPTKASAAPTSGDGTGGKSGSDAVDGTHGPTGSTSVPSTPALPSLEDRTAASGLTPTIGSSPSQAPTPIGIAPTSTPQSTRRFQRGDGVIVIVQASSASGAPVKSKSIVVSPSQSPALIIRGDQASSSSSNTASTSSNDSGSADVYTFVQYLSSIAALLSLLWLVTSSTLMAASSVSTPSWLIGDPNQWEFGVFVVHIQGLTSFSQAIATSTMPTFALRFLDAFSWGMFVPFHGSAAGIGNSRRLDAVILDGVVAFADRIGVNEANLLSKSVAGFLIVVGVVGVVVGVTSFVAQRERDQSTPAASGESDSVERDERASPVEAQVDVSESSVKLAVWIAVGMLVLLWQFALYPLTVLGSYEISMELRSNGQVRSGPLTLAVLTLGFVSLGGFVTAGVQVWLLNSREKLAKPHNIAVWGSLYDGLRVQHRLFFIALIASQVFRGVVIGSVVDGTVQLVLLLATDAVVLAAVLWLRPFQPATLMKPFVMAVVSLRVLTTALAFAFTSDASPSVRHRVATALIIVHATVLLLWLARHFGMACRQVRLQIENRHATTEKLAVSAPTPQEPEEHATPQAAAYASFGRGTHSSGRPGPGAPYSSAWDDSL